MSWISMRKEKPKVGELYLFAMCIGIDHITQEDEYHYAVGYVDDVFLGDKVDPYIKTQTDLYDFCSMDYWQEIEKVREI